MGTPGPGPLICAPRAMLSASAARRRDVASRRHISSESMTPTGDVGLRLTG